MDIPPLCVCVCVCVRTCTHIHAIKRRGVMKKERKRKRDANVLRTVSWGKCMPNCYLIGANGNNLYKDGRKYRSILFSI